MGTIWTPSGEHQPREERDPAPEPEGSSGDEGGRAGAAEPGDPDDEQLREAITRLAATPVAVVVAQYAIHLHEVAVLHLGLAAERAESLAEAHLAIDAMAALIDGMGGRLGENHAPLERALADLRLAYVTVSDQVAGPTVT